MGQYKVTFSDDRYMKQVLAAIDHDLSEHNSSGFRMKVKDNSITFDHNIIELSIILSVETREYIPFRIPLLFSGIENAAGDRPITIKRLKGDFHKTYAKELSDAKANLKKYRFSSSAKNKSIDPTYLINRLDGKNVVIAESHYDPAGREFIIENMKGFKEQGYNELVYEHLFAASQKSLDKWIFRSPENAPMPVEVMVLARYLDTASKNDAMDMGYKGTNYYTIEDVLLHAKKHQIRIKAFETEEAALSEDYDRTKMMNSNYSKIAAGGYEVSLVGADHAIDKPGIVGITSINKGISLSVRYPQEMFSDKPSDIKKYENEFHSSMQFSIITCKKDNGLLPDGIAPVEGKFTGQIKNSEWEIEK